MQLADLPLVPLPLLGETPWGQISSHIASLSPPKGALKRRFCLLSVSTLFIYCRLDGLAYLPSWEWLAAKEAFLGLEAALCSIQSDHGNLGQLAEQWYSFGGSGYQEAIGPVPQSEIHNFAAGLEPIQVPHYSGVCQT